MKRYQCHVTRFVRIQIHEMLSMTDLLLIYRDLRCNKTQFLVDLLIRGVNSFSGFWFWSNDATTRVLYNNRPLSPDCKAMLASPPIRCVHPAKEAVVRIVNDLYVTISSSANL